MLHPVACPHCRVELVPIVYGEPTAEMGRDAAAGLVVLGGCCIPPPPISRRACPRCGWRRYRHPGFETTPPGVK
jgi:hypothetical protein